MYTNIHTCENRERYTAAAASRDNGHYVFPSRCLITKCNPSAHSCLSLFGLLLFFFSSFLSLLMVFCFLLLQFPFKKEREFFLDILLVLYVLFCYSFFVVFVIER